jgi:hypothetical protein
LFGTETAPHLRDDGAAPDPFGPNIESGRNQAGRAMEVGIKTCMVIVEFVEDAFDKGDEFVSISYIGQQRAINFAHSIPIGRLPIEVRVVITQP